MEQSLNDLELIKRAQNGDEDAYEQVFSNNQLLVYSLLKKYRIRRNEYEDLKSCANLGLMAAIKKYDFSYKVTFSTYAVPLILGEIKKYFKETSLLKITRSNKERYLKINKAKEELEAKLGRSPTINEISSFLDEPLEDVISSLEANSYVSYLDETFDEDDSSFLSNLKDSNLPLMDQINLNFALESLSKKEKMIIDLRYFLGLNQEEVAKRLFISQVQISRLEKKILEKLKTQIN